MQFGHLSRIGATACAFTFAFTALSLAQTNHEAIAKIKIKNFAGINPALYRGAQPKKTDYPSLATMGIKTVLDLQREGESDEPQAVEAAGMKFYRVGMSDKSWPSPEQVEAVFKIIDDPANQPVFMHCHGGRHRTGMMTAIYRLARENWTADRACAEMDQYGFNSGMGHGGLKDYVRDYYAHLIEKAKAASAADKTKAVSSATKP